MNFNSWKAITVYIIIFMVVGCQSNYALRKRNSKQNGYIIVDNENRVFFVPSTGKNKTLKWFLMHHKEYGIWIRSNYREGEMDSVRNNLKYIGVRFYKNNLKVDSFGIAPVQIKYSMLDRAPEWLHDGGFYNSIFYVDSSLVKFTYFEALYNVKSLKLR